MATAHGDSRVAKLDALVRRTRRSLVATVLAAGLLLAAAIGLAWVAGGVVLDLAAPLSVTGRQAVWIGWWAAVAAAVGLFLVAPAARWPLLDAVALRIERAIGDAHNQLLTVVDLARRPGDRGVVQGPDGRVLRPDMVERLLAQAQDRVRGFRAADVLPWRALLRNVAVAAAAVVCLAALHAGLGERFRITLARLFDPTADIPPATWLQLRSPGDLEVLAGDPLEIRGSVVRGAVDDATLVLYDAKGRPSRQPMRADAAGSFVARLEGLDRPVRYRLEAGATWTRTHAIGILQRPEIRSVSCRVRLPDYMRIDAAIDVAPDATRIEPPEGATVEFAVAASAEAAAGSLHLFERSLARETVDRCDDRVWFEDDLPRDAVTDAPWKWTTAHAAGGLRSFGLGGDGRPLAMRTRLEPLVLPRERPDARAFTLMARSDASAPPTRLTVLLEHGQGKTELLWGDDAGSRPPAGAGRIVAGPLPQPGDWTRLTVPMKSLGHLAGQAVTGVTFAVDGGRMLLDRPGWMERTEEVVTRQVDLPVGEIPLVAAGTGPQDPLPPGGRPGDGLWTATLPVGKPTWVAPVVRSRHGHANLPAPPLEIAPTVDRPPSIVVDELPETLVLAAAVDLPITGSGFDDWGIDEVCVLAGPDPTKLAVRETLPGVSAADRPPRTQLAFATALSPELLGLAAGKSAVWKLRIRDTKGQMSETKPFRVTVLAPPESDLAKTQVPALAQARREATQLAREAAKKAAETDAKREEVRDAVAAKEPPAKKLIDELAARTDRERRMADQLAKAVEKAAEQAARSDLVAHPEKDMLAELAAEARALERQLAGSPQPRTDGASREKSDGMAAPQPSTAADAARTSPRKDVEQRRPEALSPAASDAARGKEPRAEPKPDPAGDADAASPDPLPLTPAQKAVAEKARRVAEAPLQADVEKAAKKLAESLEDAERRLAARGAALQLDALAEDLARRAERLADRPRQESAGDRAQQQAQQQAQQRTQQMVRDVEQILGERFPPAAPRPPADGPSESPQEKEPAAKQPPGTAGETQRQDATAMKQPAAAAADTSAANAGPPPAPASRAEPAAAAPAAPTAAEAAASAAAEAARSAADLAARLTAAPPAAPSPDGPGDGNAEDLLAGDELRRALAMADRARRLQARAAVEAEAAARAAARGREGRTRADGPRRPEPPARSARDADDDPAGVSEGGAMSGDAAIAPADAVRGLDARQRAALYKLPPHIRGPLIDGMRQRGPEAYQGVIDTYFRQLGKDIPQ